MNPLLDPIRHNSWASAHLLSFCDGLDEAKLSTEEGSEGTYGSIISTLQHLLGAEARYLRRLSGGSPAWSTEPEDTTDLAELARMSADEAAAWESLLAEEFDPERLIAWTSAFSGAHTECRAGILVAQTLNHGNEHRAQVFTVLTELGIEPPDLDGWSYAIATGRFSEDPPRDQLGT
ncbi:MAG TPA: DinB family protein [Actinomycetota bacterium]|nr:DinB family protein [Actinomycetota bacterium]